MTFEGKWYCRVVGLWEKKSDSPLLVGEEGGLSLALVEGGLVALGEEMQYWPVGSLLAMAGPLVLQPAGGCAVRGVTLAGQAVEEFAAGLAGILALPPGACPEAPELMFRLGQAQEEGVQSATAFAFLCLLASAPQNGPALPPLVAEALGHIHSHYGEVYGVEELAEEMGVSKGHLIRSFTAALGMPPGRYLTKVRIEAAKRLLLQAVSLETVAGLCGFSGVNYLCRVFKKETGLPPAAWKKHNTAHAARQAEKGPEWEEALYV